MLMAQLRGKVATEVWLASEDLLTSAVFGTLKNLSPSIAADLLSKAQPLKGSTPPALSGPLTWHFWPWWDTCEPDVAVEDAKTLCVIEAKLYSEFGEDAAAGAQLRREWTEGERRTQGTGKELWLVAVTNHGAMPEDEIRRQLTRSGADLSRVCWLSWLEVGRLLRGLRDEFASGWREDLLELLTRMGLAPFDGFGEAVRGVLLTPFSLPWADQVILGEERPETVGFGTVVRLVRTLSDCSRTSWRLAPALGLEFKGSAPAVSAAREWQQKGGAQWHPRLA
jgi:hypothetical protein